MLSDVVALLAPLAERRLSHPPNAFESLSGLLERIQPRGGTAFTGDVERFAEKVNKGFQDWTVAPPPLSKSVDGLIEKLRRSL